MISLELLHARTIASTETVLLQLAGELDVATAPLVDRAIAACLTSGVRRLTVDLAAVTFCDGPGLRALERAGRTAAARGVTFRLSGVHRRLRRSFSLYRAGSLIGPAMDDMARTTITPQGVGRRGAGTAQAAAPWASRIVFIRRETS
jgi:anti-anti-sigma factor